MSTCVISSSCLYMVFYFILSRISQKLLALAPKKFHPYFCSPTLTCSFIRMGYQEVQQLIVSVAKFNSLKDKLKGLAKMIMIMRRSKSTLRNQLSMTPALGQGFPPLQKTSAPNGKTFQTPQSVPHATTDTPPEHSETPQYKKEISESLIKNRRRR